MRTTETGRGPASELLTSLTARKPKEQETHLEEAPQDEAVPAEERQPAAINQAAPALDDGLKDQTQVAHTTHEDGLKAAQPEPQPAEQPQTTEQTTEQNGKDSLSAEDEHEEDFEEEDEEDFEDEEVEEQEAEPTFTDQDRADLPVLEAKVKHHGLEEAKAIREIRQRKLWMLHRNDDGFRKFKSYDEYVAERHGHSRSWATEQTQWLATIEKLADLRTLGVDVPEMLTRTAVSGMHHLAECGNYQGDTEDEQEEAGLIAVLQEASQDGKSLSGDKLRVICNRRYQFFNRYRWRAKPLAATYDDYKKDMALLEPLSKVDRSERNSGKVKEWADTNKAPMPEAVVATYKQSCSLPDDDFLLSVATGDELNTLVADLVALHDKIASIQEADQLAKISREKAHQTRQSIGVSPKTRKGKGGQPTPSVPDPEPENATTYTVELTGEFAKILGWAEKDEVGHEDLLTFFETLIGECSPITQTSSIKVVPVQGDAKADGDLDEYEPEKIGEDKVANTEKPLRIAHVASSDSDKYFFADK